MNTRRLVFPLCAAAALAAGDVRIAGKDEAPAEWRYYSGDNGAKKYSPLDQINKDNVASLKIAWRRSQLDPAVAALLPQNFRLSNNFRSTPIMIHGVMFASDGVGLTEAFEPDTGKTIWVQKPNGELTGGGSNRGVAHWSQSAEGNEERLFTFHGHSLFALNPKTGEPFPDFGDRGAVDLNTDVDTTLGQWHWTSAPLVVKDVVVMGSAMAEQDSAQRKEGIPGDVRGYDVHTGKLRWTFHVVPREGEAGIETWEEDAWRYTGAGNVWALMSADEDLGYVYLPTTSVTNDMYGGHRKGNDLFSDSIVCIDARTGRRVWYYQTVHHDLFDYDNPAAPILADITVGGKKIKAIVQITKQSFAYVLDRTNGRPVWPIEERPVPQSDVPGEKTSPTQPFPTRPPAFDRQGISESDLIDFTPELHAEAMALLKKFRAGPLFTPPSVQSDGASGRQGTIELAGSVGGADWTGAAFDPETGMLYVPSMTNPFVANLMPGDPAKTNLRYVAGDRRLLHLSNGLPITKPPYGRITAIDLNRGDIAWTVPNGDGPRNHPALKSLNLPPLGQSVRAAPLVTKTLLFVTEGDQINVRTPPGGGGNKIRAFDKATGKVVWEYEMDAGSTGTLMTYLYKDRQYIVVAIGGQRHPAEFVAFALGGAKPETVAAASSPARGEWASYGGTNWSQKYSPLDQINRDNFRNLSVAWTWTSPDHELLKQIPEYPEWPMHANGMKATPLVVNGTMYVSTGLHQIAAIDPVSGVTKWVHNPEAYKDGAQADVLGWISRGVAYWTDGKGDERILMGTLDGYLLALDARSGTPIAAFGNNGRADLTTAVRGATRHTLHLINGETHYVSVDSPPVVVRDTVIVGSSMSDRTPVAEWPPGDVQAFDVRSGKLKWVFHVIPRDGEPGADTWIDHANRTAGNGNVWSTMSGDDELGHVYLPTTTPNSDYYGGFRKGDGLFAESLVAVDVETGKRAWHFQAVHHGVWDYDFPCAPTLIDVTVGGRKIRAIAQASKQGYLYVLDRASGKPIWPIEERAVPASDIPGEALSPTQPFPTRPPAFDRQGIVDTDLIDFTPALHAEASEILKHYRHGGLFTPPSLYKDDEMRGTVQLPGSSGGANWSGSAADPDTGFVYVPSRTQPILITLTPRPERLPRWPTAAPLEGTPLPYVPNGKIGDASIHPAHPAPPNGPRGLPLVKPPYSRMTAYNLNTGEIVWQVPTGRGADAIRNNPALAGIDLPALGGQGGQGGPLVTKTLLIYGLLPTSGRASAGGQLAAYDKRTGALIGEVPLPAQPLGTPMTYAVGGRQFVALTLQGGKMIALSVSR